MINDAWYEKYSAIKPVKEIDIMVIIVHNVVAIDIAVALISMFEILSIVFSIDVWSVAYSKTTAYIKHIIVTGE